MPAPAITTIFFFLRRANMSLWRFSSSSSPWFSRSMWAVVRGFAGAAMRRRLEGGGPSVRTRISSVESDMSEGFRGELLPEVWALEEGEG